MSRDTTALSLVGPSTLLVGLLSACPGTQPMSTATAGDDAPCGDGLVEAETACDDEDTASDDGCVTSCPQEGCGDGVVGPSEECDDGNRSDDDGCDNECRLPPGTPGCGDGVVDAGEACDDGNVRAGDGCGPTCHPESCGDGVVQEGEACDDGNAIDDDGCSNACQRDGACGDGSLDDGEACDDGRETATCDGDCTASACGDGRTNPQAGEACDDGNRVDDDACGNDCELPVCGDGAVESAEACDNDSLLCSDACTALCGDGTSLETCGTHLWSKRFGELGEQIAHAVTVDAQRNIVVTGVFSDMIDFGGMNLISQGANDLFLAKFTPDGEHVWSRRSGDDRDQVGHDVAVDGEGNVIVTGEFDGTMNLGGEDLVSAGFSDLFVAKFAPSGELLWNHRFGDADFQIGRSVAVDGQGNVVITGNLWGTTNLGGDDFAALGADLFVAKFDPAGAHLWSRHFAVGKNQIGKAVAIDGQDNVLVAGDYYGNMNLGGDDLISAGLLDVFVAKFTPAGAHVWSLRAGDPEHQYASSLAVDGEDNVVLLGFYEGALNFGGADLASAGLRDLYVAKFAPTGAHLWSERFGDGANQYSEDVAVDGQDNVVITGWFQGTMNLGGDDLISAGAPDVFLAKFTAAGAHLWSRRSGDTNSQAGKAVAVDGQGDVVTAGNFAGMVNLGGDDLVPHGVSDIFLAKMGS